MCDGGMAARRSLKIWRLCASVPGIVWVQSLTGGEVWVAFVGLYHHHEVRNGDMLAIPWWEDGGRTFW